MKLLLPLFLLATAPSLVGADMMYAHVQQFPLDAYAAAWTSAQPDIPGSGKPDCGVTVSISTTDELAQAFVVYIRVRLEDGTEAPLKSVVARLFEGATTVRFSTGHLKPIKVLHFWVLRLHSEPEDLLMMDLN